MSLDTVTTNSVSSRKISKRARGRKMQLTTKACIKEQPDFKTPDIDVEDYLGLEMLNVPDIPQDMLFPGEYNAFLQESLKRLTEENKQLCACTKQQNEELSLLKSKLSVLEDNHGKLQRQGSISDTDPSHYADMAACRVMDLTRQVCELTAQLEEQKTRSSLAESKLLSVIGSQDEHISTELLNKKETEIRTLTEKLQATTAKLHECRNRVQQLQHDLKIAHKVLACEIGDGNMASDLIAKGGNSLGWRGRAQQIQLLQQRVMELTDRLRKFYDSRNENKLLPLSVLKQSEKEKRTALEAAQEEARSAQLQLLDNTRKLDAARARVKVVESELHSLKTRLQLLMDKGSRDDQLINVLQGQVNQLEERLKLSKNESQIELRKVESQQQQMMDDLRMEKQRNIQAMSSLEDKDQQIKRLEKLLFDMRTSVITKPDCMCSSSLGSEDQESPNHEEDQTSRTADVERKKLLELIAVVNKRLSDARQECDKHKNALRLERQKVVRLEAKLARQELERGSFGMSYRQMACATKKAAAVSTLPDGPSLSKEELLDKIEILKEEVLTLRTRLACLELEKEDDLRTFSSILEGVSHSPLEKRGPGPERISSSGSLIPKRLGPK